MVGRLDEWHPLTGHVAFIEAGLDAVADARQAQERKWGRSGETRRMEGEFPDVLATLVPLDGSELIVPGDGWCAVFEGSFVADLGAVVLTLIERLGCRAVHATSLPNSYGGGRGANTSLSLFDPTNGDAEDGLLRLIELTYDDSGWDFGTVGEPQPWEEPGAYKARRTAERFPPELLLRYLDAVGVPPLDGPGWGPGAVLVPSGNPADERFPTIAALRENLYG